MVYLKNNRKNNITFKRKVLAFYYRIKFFFKFFLVLLFCMFFFTDLFAKQKKQIKISFFDRSIYYGFGVKNVIIEGKRNIDNNEMLSMLNLLEKNNRSIFSISLKKIKDNLESHRWIKKAIVERRLPNTIYIAIIEKVPIAVWQYNNQLFLIDSEGKIISSNIKEYTKILHVVGVDANIHAYSLIKNLEQYPDLQQKVILAIRYGQRRWDLHLTDKIIIKMPAENFSKAYNYINQLNLEGKLFNQKYKVFDLRNINKYYFSE